MSTFSMSRRRLLAGGGLVAVGGALAACGGSGASPTAVSPHATAVARAEARRRHAGARVVDARLRPRPVTLDLGGPTVHTWAYGDEAPGPLIRARAGDVLRVRVDNRLPDATTVHWHGLAIRNDMDGVPDVTQQAIRSGAASTYEFTASQPGTYWYHSHVGTQLDRGLYGPLIIDDPREPGRYDAEFVVVLDDWLDGVGRRTPDAELRKLSKGMMSGMGDMDGKGHGMDMGGMSSPILGDAGDVTYPHYLVNGRVPDAPRTLRAKPGKRVRIRLINAGADTAFRVALGGHRLTVTHTDGFPVHPVTVDALLIGMGERYDVETTLDDGVFPLVAAAEGKKGLGRALMRTGGGSPPSADARPAELRRRLLKLTDLRADDSVALPARAPDRTHPVKLGGDMNSYVWTINGRTYDKRAPLPVRQGENVRLNFTNQTMMFHPMHLHGHTFQLRGPGWTGPRKDTVIVAHMQKLTADLIADNPGQWVLHCHNVYHQERGMMTVLSYRTA